MINQKSYNLGKEFADTIDVDVYHVGGRHCVSITWGENYFETDPYKNKEYALSEAKGYLEGMEQRLEAALNDINNRLGEI